MNLTPEQKQAVSSWVAAGDSLSAVQKKLLDQFKISMTYMDVRFLVDDLNLSLKDPAPKADASDVTKAPAPRSNASAAGANAAKPEEKKGLLGRAKEKLGLGKNEAASQGRAGPAGEEGELPPEGAEFAEDDGLGGEDFGQGAGVNVTVDKVTLIPGAIASGTVTFSDGVTGKWIVDNYGRPGFTEVSQPGYRPSPADAQTFMQELNLALQQRGF
jgi:hypothetical protein